MTGRDDDQSLVEACRSGSVEAFGVLVRRYEDRLYATLLGLVGRPEDAHDLLQDAFLRAYQKLGGFHGDSSFYTWVHRIAVNLALSDRRRRRPATGHAESWAEPIADPSHADPTLPAERAEREAAVQRALRSLAPDHRAVVVLKDLDGLRYEEIAAILAIPVGTVRSRLHRARGELRERLKGLVDGEPASAGPRGTD